MKKKTVIPKDVLNRVSGIEPYTTRLLLPQACHHCVASKGIRSPT